MKRRAPKHSRAERDRTQLEAARPKEHSPQSAAKKCLGRFQLQRKLRANPRVTVYLAYDPQLDRDLELAVLRSDYARRRADDYLGSCAAVARLNHPHIVPIMDAGRVKQRVYAARWHVDGKPLREAGEGRTLTAAEAVELTAAVAEALEHAHLQGVPHRQVGLDTVLIDARLKPHLVDFSAVRRPHRQPSPQDAEQQEPPPLSDDEIAEDVRGAGRLLAVLLAGNIAADGQPEAAEEDESPGADPAPLEQLPADIPRDLRAICRQALQGPQPFYRRCGDLAEDLRRWQRGEPTAARPLGVVPRTWRWCRRQPQVATLSGLILLFLVSLAAGLLLVTAKQEATRRRIRSELQTARQNRSRAEEKLSEAETTRKDLAAVVATLEEENARIEQAGGDIGQMSVRLAELTEQTEEVARESQQRQARLRELDSQLTEIDRSLRAAEATIAQSEQALEGTFERYVETLRQVEEALGRGQHAQALLILHSSAHQHRGWEWAHLHERCFAASRSPGEDPTEEDVESSSPRLEKHWSASADPSLDGRWVTLGPEGRAASARQGRTVDRRSGRRILDVPITHYSPNGRFGLAPSGVETQKGFYFPAWTLYRLPLAGESLSTLRSYRWAPQKNFEVSRARPRAQWFGEDGDSFHSLIDKGRRVVYPQPVDGDRVHWIPRLTMHALRLSALPPQSRDISVPFQSQSDVFYPPEFPSDLSRLPNLRTFTSWLRNRQLLVVLEGDGQESRYLTIQQGSALHPLRRWGVAVGTFDLDLSGGTAERKRDEKEQAATLSPDGRLIATSEGVFSLEEGYRISPALTSPPLALHWSGDQVLTLNAARTHLLVLRLVGPRPVTTLTIPLPEKLNRSEYATSDDVVQFVSHAWSEVWLRQTSNVPVPSRRLHKSGYVVCWRLLPQSLPEIERDLESADPARSGLAMLRLGACRAPEANTRLEAALTEGGPVRRRHAAVALACCRRDGMETEWSPLLGEVVSSDEPLRLRASALAELHAAGDRRAAELAAELSSGPNALLRELAAAIQEQAAGDTPASQEKSSAPQGS